MNQQMDGPIDKESQVFIMRSLGTENTIVINNNNKKKTKQL
jgi:hypothetical protein